MAALVRYLGRFRGFSRDAKLFLLSATISSVSYSVVWLMLNFYLESLGHGQAFIGWVNALPALTTVLVGVPIGILSDRFSRKWALVAGAALSAAAATGIVIWTDPLPLILFTALWGIGGAILGANGAPFMAKHSNSPQQRTALFSAQAALTTGTGFLGSLLGGYFPELFAGWFGGSSRAVLPLQLTLGVVALLQTMGVFPLLFVHRKGRLAEKPLNALQSIAGSRAEPPTAVPLPSKRRWGLEHPALFAKLLLPAMLIGLGAGQTMPFLNLFVTGKFGISFAELGWLFAVSALVTALGILLQPALADRLGRVRSVVAVQWLSLPFLVMLGFAPFFPLVALSLLIRGMLMNMANPVYMAFCMEQLPERERATFTGAYEVVWNLGWATGAAFSGWWRDLVGFEVGFNTNFALMAILYSLGTLSVYAFFGRKREAHRPEPYTAREH